MYGIGIIKGTLIGISLGFMAALSIKKICKMKNAKKNSSTGQSANNIKKWIKLNC